MRLSSGKWQLTHEGARNKIRQCFSPSWEGVRRQLVDKKALETVSSLLWTELFVQRRDVEPEIENKEFRRMLQNTQKTLFQKYTRFFKQSQARSEDRDRKRCSFYEASRQFFIHALEADVVRVLAHACDILPLHCGNVLTMSDFSLNSLCYQQNRHLCSWLMPPLTEEGHIVGTRVLARSVESLNIPRTKYEALFHACPHFDAIRESFLIEAQTHLGAEGLEARL